MMTSWKKLITLVFLGVCLAAGGSYAGEKKDFSTTPKTKEGKKWRIAYYEGGPHQNYDDYLLATVQGLMALGWLETAQIPVIKDTDTKTLWKWLSEQATSSYLEFVKDGYYSANWDNGLRGKARSELLKRLQRGNDIDMLIAMGTWAGKDFANNEHSVPTIVMSTSDPVQSGIIKSVEDSGYDHVHVRVDPRRYERQLRMFHDIVDFKRLGVAYEDSVSGRSYAAIETIEKLSEELHFDITRCRTQSDISDVQVAEHSVVDCFQKLAKGTDAIYVTHQGGINQHSIPQLVKIANDSRIPTFAQAGSEEVRYGFLLSLSRPNFKSVGLFLASTIAKVLNGAKPRQLNQVFEETPTFAINLKTAELLGIYLYAEVLAAADEIYREIETPAP